MANVKLKYRGPLKDKLKISEEIVLGEEVSDVLKYIKELYGTESYRLAKSMLITINGESILKRRIFKTKLNDGDVISFLPVSAGG